MDDTVNQKKNMSPRRAPPKNEIVTEKLGHELRRKVDGLILDNDITYTEVRTIRTDVRGLVAWGWGRDMFMILLLLLLVGLIVWRGLTVEHHLQQCESVGALSPIQG